MRGAIGESKAAAAGVLRLEHKRSPSHSWWWDSHNSPKHSKWLQSDLRELDEKVKEMLKLIEEDADSFAKRAEMYYQKRPELVSLVEEFYRAYRSLAERYDHLTGEIRQNIPRALQVQYGLSSSCDSPSSAQQRPTYSPLRKATQILHFTNDEALCRSPPPPPPPRQSTWKCSLNDISASPPEKHIIEGCSGLYSTIDMNYDGKENGNSVPLSEEGFSCSSDDSEGDLCAIVNPLTDDDVVVIDNLRQEIERLEQENRCLTESHKQAIQCNAVLQDRIKVLEEEYACSRKMMDELANKLGEINAVDHVLFNMANISRSIKIEEISGISSIVRNEMQEVATVPLLLKDKFDGCPSSFPTGEEAGREELNMASLINVLQSQLAFAMKENEKQKLAIVERGEEKKEAIRQLCFAMDILHTKNQRLQEVVGVLKKKVNASNTTVGTAAITVPFSFESWSKFFTGEWGTSKASSPPYTIAL